MKGFNSAYFKLVKQGRTQFGRAGSLEKLLNTFCIPSLSAITLAKSFSPTGSDNRALTREFHV